MFRRLLTYASSTKSILQGSEDRDRSIWWMTALSCQYPIIYKPVLDGYVLPEKYIDTLRHGPPNDVPLITGNNEDESGASTSTNYTVAEYKRDCKLKYDDLFPEYLKLYPANNTTQADRSWNAAARATSVISSWFFANKWIQPNIYLLLGPCTTRPEPGSLPRVGSWIHHEQSVRRCGHIPYTWYDYYLADVKSSYWANFVKTGNPNKGGSYKYETLTHWAPNDGKSRSDFHVGQGFGNQAIAEPGQVRLIMEYFVRQTPY